MKQPAKWFCDFCGKEIPENRTHRAILVLKNAEPEEGKPCKAYLDNEYYDICDGCYVQTTNVAAGPRGEHPHFIFEHK